MTGFQDCSITVADGLKLHFRDYIGGAERPPLLCLHGLTRNGRDFEEFAQHYSPRFRVLILDFRGRGLSDYDPDPSRYNPLTYAGDVIALLDQLAIDQAVFVGTSLGGLVTMTIDALAPKRIAGAILNDIGPELEQAGLDRIQAYVGRDARFESWEDAAEAIAGSQGRAYPNYTVADWIAMAKRNCRAIDGKIVFDYDPAIAIPLKNAGAAPKVDLLPFFRALGEKPLLVLRGEQSDLLSSETLERMRAAVPKGDFVTVPGVGHAPDLNEPEAVSAIDRFLADLPAG